MANTTISGLPQAAVVNDNDVFPADQGDVTRKLTVAQAKRHIQADVLTALATETQARIQGDANTLTSAKSHTDTAVANEAALRQQGDVNTLASAKAYSDQVGADTLAAAQEHTDTVVASETSGLIGLPQWNNNNYILTFRTRNGETLTIDLPLEVLAQDIDYDPETKEIIIIKHDGTEIRIDVSDLVDVYTGSTGAHIQIAVDSGNVIRATLLSGTISEAELAVALVAKIDGKIDRLELAEAIDEHNRDGNTHADIRAEITAETETRQMEVEGLTQAVVSLETETLKQDQLGVPHGVAALDSDGKVPTAQLPGMSGGGNSDGVGFFRMEIRFGHLWVITPGMVNPFRVNSAGHLIVTI